MLAGPGFCQEQADILESFDRSGSLPPQWKIIAGNWRVFEGQLLVDSMQDDSQIVFGNETWQDYEITAKVTFRKVRDQSRWLSIVFRTARDGNSPWSHVPVRFDATKKNGVEFAVRTKNKDWAIRQTTSDKNMFVIDQVRLLKVSVRGSHVQAWLDSNQVIDSHYCIERDSGCVGLAVSGCDAAFDDVTVVRLPDSRKAADSVNKGDNKCDNVAHRGFSAVAPENTLAAIQEAIDAGASGCEFDVYGCKGGTVVLMHDKTVDRTSNGTGKITELSLNELSKLDAGSWKDAKYAGEKIPTLRDALLLLRGTGCQSVIEIKMEGISNQVVDTVRELKMENEVAVIAFSKNVVREIRTLAPGITCAWLSSESLQGTIDQRADWIAEQASQCGAKLVDLNYKMLSPELIQELKRRGLAVWTWTVDEPAVMKALKRWGIDSITTNRPDLF
ncbi:MAG: glycerophosphodiester phosphodiesterase family protein [Pirellulaceae bacterium]